MKNDLMMCSIKAEIFRRYMEVVVMDVCSPTLHFASDSPDDSVMAILKNDSLTFDLMAIFEMTVLL